MTSNKKVIHIFTKYLIKRRCSFITQMSELLLRRSTDTSPYFLQCISLHHHIWSAGQCKLKLMIQSRVIVKRPVCNQGRVGRLSSQPILRWNPQIAMQMGGMVWCGGGNWCCILQLAQMVLYHCTGMVGCICNASHTTLLCITRFKHNMSVTHCNFLISTTYTSDFEYVAMEYIV